MTTLSSIDFICQQLGVAPVATDQKFTMQYAEDILYVKIVRSPGHEEIIRKLLTNNFSILKAFDHTMLTKEEKTILIQRLRIAGFSMFDISEFTGIPQSSVANELRS